MQYYLSLGSNLGAKTENLARARRRLEQSGVRVVRCSSLYRTQPVGRRNQPWFVNQVIEIAADLRPLALLRLLKKVEEALGRRPGPVHGPRVIDIDILLAGKLIQRGKTLTIPHPRLPQRNFVLVPLEEIAADTVHPVFKKTVSDLCRACSDSAVVRRLKTPGRAGRSAGEGPRQKKRPGRPGRRKGAQG